MVVHLPLPTAIPPAPSNPLSQLGRLTHFAFDAVLFSAFLAGVKRSTGLTYVLKDATYGAPNHSDLTT
jgi:hypothetical protein